MSMGSQLHAAEHEAETTASQGTLVDCQLMVPRFVAEHSGQHLAVNGSASQLGSWTPSQAVRLLPSDKEGTVYTAIVQLPLGEKIEAKVR